MKKESIIAPPSWYTAFNLPVAVLYAPKGRGFICFEPMTGVTNVFNQTSTNNVWRFTGLPDSDGFLATAEGARFLSDKPPVGEELYHHRNRVLGWVGLPRQTRIGLRMDF